MASSNPESPLLRVERRGNPLENGDLGPRLEMLGQHRTHLTGTFAIVGPHERNLDLGPGQRLLVEFVIDVDDDDSCARGLREHRYQGTRIGRCNHDRVDPQGDHLLDQRDLLSQIALVLDAIDDEVVCVGVGLVMRLGSLGHRDEEFIGQRLHDQGDAGAGIEVRLGRGRLAASDRDEAEPETPTTRTERALVSGCLVIVKRNGSDYTPGSVPPPGARAAHVTRVIVRGAVSVPTRGPDTGARPRSPYMP